MSGKRFAVLIGNGSFPGEGADDRPRLPPLRCPSADVRGLGGILGTERHGGYAVTALIDRPHSEAKRAVYESLRKAGPDDQVVIYYSGHGKLDEGGNLFLAGCDTDPEFLDPTALSAADVQKYVADSRAGSRIVILDCCFSGAVDRVFRGGSAKGEDADQAGQAVRGLRGEGVFYLTASTDTQTAEEKDDDHYSLLTKHIINGIASGKADIDDDGEVRFSELCRFVQDRTRQEGTQRPLSFIMKSYGDPVVALTGRPALAARREAVERDLSELRRREIIDGADLAQILGWIHRPAREVLHGGLRVEDLVESLHAARANPPAFLKIIHGALSREQVVQAGGGTGSHGGSGRSGLAGGSVSASEPTAFLAKSLRLRPVVVVSVVVIGTIAVTAGWLFYPNPEPAHTTQSSPAADSGSLVTAPPVPLVNPGGAVSLVNPGAPSLVRPSGIK